MLANKLLSTMGKIPIPHMTNGTSGWYNVAKIICCYEEYYPQTDIDVIAIRNFTNMCKNVSNVYSEMQLD